MVNAQDRESKEKTPTACVQSSRGYQKPVQANNSPRKWEGKEREGRAA
jgi:hypothetical protein